MINPFELLKHSRDIEKYLGEIKKKNQQTQFESSVGAGKVTIKINGNFDCLEIKIDEKLTSDLAMLQDLVRSAFNDAARKARAGGSDSMMSQVQELLASGQLDKLMGKNK